mmetsp:Transcript_51227/g.166024  ORF Transcript_51227/g.166024 Transcript_51227/m.166024 type:complete len:824 (+) Transcript_51227:178-2649(+)
MSFDSRYDKLDVLGEGAFGTAYLVAPKGSRNSRQVAKEVRISHLSEEQRKSALAESEVLKMMKHFNIVAHIDTFMDGARLYIVMEYADGGDLAAKIKERKGDSTKEAQPFEERQIMFFFVQICLALQHIHAQHVLHRDLKPLNIFLTRQGIVKLGDFGIARVIESSMGAQTMIGTPHYLSPEMCNSEAYGSKSDLWSLGVVTYELAALRVPFPGTCLPAVAMQIIGADPEPLAAGYSRDLSWIVFGFLEKTPAKRPMLDKVLCLPFVQQYIQLNLSHTMQKGSGGCEPGRTERRREVAEGRAEPTVVSVRHRESKPASRQDPDRMLVDQPTLDSDKLQEIRDARRQPDRRPAEAEELGELRVSARESRSRGSRHGAGQHGARMPAELGDRDARGSVSERPRGVKHGEPRHGARHVDYKSADMNEEVFVPERQQGRSRADSQTVSIEEKYRQIHAGRQAAIEQEYVRNRQAAAETKRRAEAPGLDTVSVVGGYNPMQQRQSSEAKLEDAERRKVEVKRKGQEERDQLEQARRRDLEQAMREAAEDRRRLKQRMLGMQELQDAVDDCREASALAPEVPDGPEPELVGAREDSGGGNAMTSVFGDTTLVVTPDFAHEDDSRQSSGFVIPFFGKVKPKPKLSSEGRTSRMSRNASGDPGQDLVTPSAPSSSPAPRAGGKRGGGPLAKNLPAVVERQGGRRPPKLPSTPGSLGAPDDEGAGRPLPRAAGSPASWLRENRGQAGDEDQEEVAKVLVRSRFSAQPPDVIEIPSSPVGHGDVTQLQDALAKALCGVQGQKSPARSESSVPEEIAVQSLYSWRQDVGESRSS